jgi:tetratricopeptide (TPR) repeat protein
MVCTDWRCWCLGLLLALGAGCAQTPKSKKKPPQADQSSAAVVQDGAPITLIPNPYLAQEIKVPPAAQTSFRNALVAMQSEDWRTAETQLRALAEAHPQLSGPQVNLGLVYWRQNKLEEAETAFKQALAINPLNNDAYVQYGYFLREQGRFNEAEAVYLKALEVWPHNLAAHRNLGILYDLYMGKFDAAMKHYEMVLRLSPEPNKEVEGWIIDLKRRLAAG